jgi:predicted GNAT family N-acyltransferase
MKVGAQLMQQCLTWLGSDHEIFVVVASYNNKAIEFYRRFGFVETGKHIEDTSAKERGDKEIPEIEMVRKAP